MDDRWSNLPEDLLRRIVSRMHLTDQIRSAAVCKAWNRQRIKDVMHRDKLPWLMLYHWAKDPVESVCKLDVPFEEKTYTVKDAYMGENSKTFAGAKACDSKKGWVLFSCKRRGKKYKNLSISFFAFSPFSNKIVKLPDLKKDFQKATFSSTPTSPDCVFFSSYHGRHISIYRQGDPTWKTIDLDALLRPDYITASAKDVAYLSGSFYCLFSGGTLGSFNVSNKQWSVLKYRYPKYMRGTPSEYDCLRSSDVNGKDFLIESDGKLLKLRLDYESYHFEYTHWYIERFDFSESKWVEEASLGNQAVFLNSTTFSFSIPALGEASELADTVTFYGLGRDVAYTFFDGLRTYCFKTGKYIEPFKPCASVLEYGLKRIWFEPPQYFSS